MNAPENPSTSRLLVFVLFCHAAWLSNGCGEHTSIVTTPKRSVVLADNTTANATSPLIIVGGGGTPDVVKQRAIELAGGPTAPVVIIPQASRRAESGAENVAFWKKTGATNVTALTLKPEQRATEIALLKQAKFIWFSGGDQSRLMDALRDANLIDLIKQRHRAGIVIGGTSAGAAVMSQRMIIGNAELEAIVRGGTPLADGLGLWPGTIVDQHFHRRRRFNRLLSAVLDHPDQVGIGIDERTAVIVQADGFEVMGESSVLVIDARRAKAQADSVASNQSKHHDAQDVRVYLVSAGNAFSITSLKKVE